MVKRAMARLSLLSVLAAAHPWSSLAMAFSCIECPRLDRKLGSHVRSIVGGAYWRGACLASPSDGKAAVRKLGHGGQVFGCSRLALVYLPPLRGGSVRTVCSASDGADAARTRDGRTISGRLHSLEDTEKLARILSETVEKGDVILLRGDVGCGKTTLARAFIRKLSEDEDLTVASPSFLLHLQYPCKDFTINHLDLYRLGQSKDILFLGLDKVLPDGVSLIEWPSEGLEALLPESYLTINLMEDKAFVASQTFEVQEEEAEEVKEEDADEEEEEEEDFALPPMDGPRIIELVATGERWKELLVRISTAIDVDTD